MLQFSLFMKPESMEPESGFAKDDAGHDNARPVCACHTSFKTLVVKRVCDAVPNLPGVDDKRKQLWRRKPALKHNPADSCRPQPCAGPLCRVAPGQTAI